MPEEKLIDETKLKYVVSKYNQNVTRADERQEVKDKEDHIFDYFKEDKLDQF